MQKKGRIQIGEILRWKKLLKENSESKKCKYRTAREKKRGKIGNIFYVFVAKAAFYILAHKENPKTQACQKFKSCSSIYILAATNHLLFLLLLLLLHCQDYLQCSQQRSPLARSFGSAVRISLESNVENETAAASFTARAQAERSIFILTP